jgi:hypothetical protein
MEPKSKEQQKEITAEMYLAFWEGEGRLPEGFSFSYGRGTPFDSLLNGIEKETDLFWNKSGISDWIYLSDSVEINAAAAAIANWARRHREMGDRMCFGEKCKALFPYCSKKVMVVIDHKDRFDGMTEETIRNCQDAGVLFCTVQSFYTLYDLIEKRLKIVEYETHPNYHDETHGSWWIE